MSPRLLRHSTHFPLLTTLPFDLKTIHLMDSVSTVPPSVAYRIMSTLPKQLPITTPQLPPEILLQIFRELHELQPLSELRLVAKQFYGLATPIYYNHVTLTDRLIPGSSLGVPQSELGATRSRFALCMQAYTENVTFECLLECECRAVLELLMSLTRLSSIKSAMKRFTTVLC